MKKRMIKIAACLMAGTMTVTGTGFASMAAGPEVALVGIQAQTTSQEYTDSSDTSADGIDYQEATGKYGNIAIAQVNDDAYVNIRDQADTEKGSVLGKLYNNSAATIVGEEGDWYLIESGSVTGYVSKDYFVTGAEAEALAKQVGYETATVSTTTLMVRSDVSTESDVITMVGDGETLPVVEDLGDWVKVAIDDDVEGYVSKDYVNCETQFVEAESKEEEAARVAAEEAAYLAALEEARIADEAAQAAAQAEWDAQNEAWQNYLDSQEQADADYAAEQAAASQAEAEQAAAAQAAAEAAAAEAQAKADEDADAADAAAAAEAAAAEAAQAAADAQAKADAEAAAAAEAQAKAEEEARAKAEADANQTPSQDEVTGEGNTQDNQDQQFGDASGGSAETDAPQTSTSSGQRQSVVSFAIQFVGNPYVWGGTSLTNGADCSGFTQSVLANFGISIPRTAAEQAGSGRAVSLSDIQPGDLLFYNGDGGIGHVSMYIGNNQVVHASTSTTGIIISDLGYRQACSARSYID